MSGEPRDPAQHLAAQEAADDSATGDAATAVAAPAARRVRESGPLSASDASDSGFETAPTELGTEASTRNRSRPTSIQPTGYSTASTPLEAMRVDEWERTKIFCRMAVMITVSMFIVGPLIGGDPTAKLIMYVGAFLAAASLVWVLVSLRHIEGYTLRLIFPAAMVVVTSVQTGVYFFGVFSPAPALILLGIYFFSKGQFANTTTAIYVICAVSLGLLGGLIVAGIIEDRGLIRGDNLAAHEKVIVLLIVQMLYLVSFVIARGARRSQLMALTKLEEAMRQVGVRDALLQEAQGDLNRALRIGDAGRHTDEVVGGYRLGVLIGRGGMGEVYDAQHTETRAEAAVKLLHPAALASPDQLGRFLREIEAISMIEVPEVVEVYKFGHLVDGAPYLVMEKLVGVDLSTYLRKRRRMTATQVVELIRQIGRGLTAAWELGIVHRDIKPQNLFRVGSGKDVSWKVLDFGVSKLASSTGTLTQGHVVGTPGYMAPEQARGEQVDSRADLYALAVIAYRALTGRPAFSAKDVPATMYEVVYCAPHKPSDVAPNLDPGIDYALAIGIAKDPSDRYTDPEELARVLEQAAAGELPERIRHRAEALLAELPWKDAS